MQSPRSVPVVALEERRRLRRTAQFVAAIMRATIFEEVTALGCPVPELKYLSQVGIDVGATREQFPALRRTLIGFVRRRRITTVLARLRDPVPDVAEVTFDVAYCDSESAGIAFLEHYSLWTDTGARWWLVGRPGEIILRVTPEGFTPTLTEPWREGGFQSRWRGGADADRALGEFIWNG